MRTSASYMFDGQPMRASVALEDGATISIEFSDDDRKHYIRMEGLTHKTCAELSKSLALAVNPRDFLIDDFVIAIKEWDDRAKECSDRDVAKAYRQDAKYLRKVLSLVKKSKYKEAWTMANALQWQCATGDTIVSDLIPVAMWDFIAGKINS